MKDSHANHPFVKDLANKVFDYINKEKNFFFLFQANELDRLVRNYQPSVPS